MSAHTNFQSGTLDRWRVPAVLVALLLLAGCYTQTPQFERPAWPAGEAENYYGFASADELADWLRADSEAGVLVSAHRGGPAPGYPENAIPTFERTLYFGSAIIECDVRMSADGRLVLMHDETIGRTTTGSGRVEEMTLAELRQVRLLDDFDVPTPYRINTLAEALSWADGRVVLTLDIKPGVPPERVVDLIERHNAASYASVIVYNLDDLQRYHELMPELVISATAESIEEAEAIIESGVELSRLMVFTGVGEADPELNELLRAHNIRPILGTFGEIDRMAMQRGPKAFAEHINQGVDVIATNAPHLALTAARTYRPAPLPNPLTLLHSY